jgi:hypothetical protein
MKIKTVVYLWAFILLWVSGCGTAQFTKIVPVTPTNIPVITPFSYRPVLPLNDISNDIAEQNLREEIARKLTHAWLDYFLQEDLPSKVRLQEYFILSVSVPAEWQIDISDPDNQFRAEIRFGVKILEPLYNAWYAGGGTVSEDHLWVIRTEHPLVIREDDEFTFWWDWYDFPTPVP